MTPRMRKSMLAARPCAHFSRPAAASRIDQPLTASTEPGPRMPGIAPSLRSHAPGRSIREPLAAPADAFMSPGVELDVPAGADRNRRPRLPSRRPGLSTLFLAFGFVRCRYASAESEVARFRAPPAAPGHAVAPIGGGPGNLCRPHGRGIPGAQSEPVRVVRSGRRPPRFPNSTRRTTASRASSPACADHRGARSLAGRAQSDARPLQLRSSCHLRRSRARDWPDGPAARPLVEALLRGSGSPAGEVSFAADYDVDDDEIEDAAPILIDDADAAQHSALIDVMRGKNLAIEEAGSRQIADHRQHRGERSLCRQDGAARRQQARSARCREMADGCRRSRRFLS